jgi:hypothetical protein
MQAILRIALLVATLILTVGCAHDQRREVAFKTLFPDERGPDLRAFSAVLNAKFPRGSEVAALETWAASVGGNCRVRDPNSHWCEIPLREKFCVASMLGVTSTDRDGRIESMKVDAGGIGC